MNVDAARHQMVFQQARAWDVFEPRVLDTLGSVAREHFVPETYRHLAFADTEIPLGNGEYMMTPTHEGRLLQALSLSGDERVLEVGTGSGFLTACLANLCEQVVSVDINAAFVDNAGRTLSEQGVENIELMTLDATRDLPPGPFDAIAVTGSIERFDARWLEPLADDGRLFIVVGQAPVMDARIVTRSGDKDWTVESLFETVLKPLSNAALPPTFQF